MWSLQTHSSRLKNDCTSPRPCISFPSIVICLDSQIWFILTLDLSRSSGTSVVWLIRLLFPLPSLKCHFSMKLPSFLFPSTSIFPSLFLFFHFSLVPFFSSHLTAFLHTSIPISPLFASCGTIHVGVLLSSTPNSFYIFQLYILQLPFTSPYFCSIRHYLSFLSSSYSSYRLLSCITRSSFLKCLLNTPIPLSPSFVQLVE